MLEWPRLDSLVRESERVLLTTHVRPDGDALGSELALAELLTQKGKEVEIFNASPTPDRYSFVDPDRTRIRAMENGIGAPRIDPDLVMVLDTGTWSQLAGLTDYVKRSTARKVVIDHHATQDDLGALRLVDEGAAACCMLVHEAFGQLGGTLTPQAADNLFLGIAMDTGWVRHSNTSAEVLETLGRLVTAGARPTELYRQLFETNSAARLRLLGRMLGRLATSLDGRLVTGVVHQEDIRAAGAHPMDTEDFITYPMSVAGAESALLFIEQHGGGTKVSFRTRGPLDCSKLAEQFGGGGHRPAAGASLDLPIGEAIERVVKATESAMTGGA